MTSFNSMLFALPGVVSFHEVLLPAVSLCMISSVNVFHSLQAGHLPDHLGDSWPQLLQKNAFLILLIE
jgi:hypothetical protein